MKTMINFSVVVMMAVFSVCVAQAESLTVFDNGHKCCFTDKDMTMTFKSGEGFQVIYPESALSSMKGKQINAMMYYMDGTHGNGIDCSKVRASLGISTEASFTSKDYISGLTQVGTASLSAGEKEILCHFDKPFVYTGGNLVLSVTIESDAQYNYQTWIEGAGQSSNTINMDGYLGGFIPKTTFEFGEAK